MQGVEQLLKSSWFLIFPQITSRLSNIDKNNKQTVLLDILTCFSKFLEWRMQNHVMFLSVENMDGTEHVLKI